MSRTLATYVVSGAGTTDVNGTYIETGTDVFYFGVEYTLRKESDGKWRILFNESEYYITTDTPATPDLGTWVKGQHGTDPPPTVIAGTPIPAKPDILVSGAGTDSINGTYENTGFADGKSRYTKAGTSCVITYLWYAWFILDSWDLASASGYMGAENVDTPDLVTTWEPHEGGELPVPTVTEYTPPHDIAVDPLTVQANITQPTLRQTHIINVEPLSANAGLTESTPTQTGRTFATYVVSGAGMMNVNGRYVPSGNNEFTLENGKFKIWNNNIYWFIKSNEDFTNPYKTTDNPATPDLGTWVKVQAGGGIDPPPTVVAGTPLPANPDILVSGAGSDLVNGTYEHTAFEDGKPMYTKGSEQYRIASDELWQILAPYTHPELGDVDYPYYQEKQSESGSSATPDLVAEWEIWTMEDAPVFGVSPPPNVTEYTSQTLSQTHKLSATALSASGNITEPTLSQTQSLTVGGLSASARLSDIELTQTHTLDINSLTANAGLTEPTLTQTHIINIEPLGIVADFVDVDFAQTHVIEIEPLWAYVELSDLTLAQYIRTPTPDCRRLRIGREDRTLEVRCH